MAEKGMSKNKVKKRLRNPNKNFDAKQKVEYQFCEKDGCSNPRVRLLILNDPSHCNLSLRVRKPTILVSDQVRHKPACTVTETG